MRFFANSTMNRLYVHAGLLTFAENAGGVFVFVYLLKAGLSAPLVLCSFAAILMSRIVLRQAVVPVVKRIGVRNGILVGIGFEILSYAWVPFITGAGPVLLGYILISGLGTTFYWTCYHAFTAQLGDAEARGSQVGAREAINALTGIAAPLVGSFLLVHSGANAAFFTAAAIEALSLLPLLGAPNLHILAAAEVSPRAKNQARLIFFCDGFLAACNAFTWYIALFVTLGQNFGAFGGTLAFSACVGAGMTLISGRMIDKGHYRKSLNVAFSLVAMVILMKAFGFGTVWMAIAASALGAVAAPLYMAPLMSRIYNLSKASACPLRFHVAAEGGFDLGAGAGCLIAAALIHSGFGYFWPISLGLLACAGGYIVLLISDPDASASIGKL